MTNFGRVFASLVGLKHIFLHFGKILAKVFKVLYYLTYVLGVADFDRITSKYPATCTLQQIVSYRLLGLTQFLDRLISPGCTIIFFTQKEKQSQLWSIKNTFT